MLRKFHFQIKNLMFFKDSFILKYFHSSSVKYCNEKDKSRSSNFKSESLLSTKCFMMLTTSFLSGGI